MVPPRTKRNVGAGDFQGTGREFLNLFIREGGLLPEHKVLDVGCGIGRMAAPLTGYLKSGYCGFDIVKDDIEWCRENISSRFGNFHFAHADIRNNFYNPDGRHEAESYSFPYGREEFDFVFLTSVFTHMFPPSVNNYLREISGVLKPGCTCSITMFLINEESMKLIDQGRSSQNFIHELDGCFTAYRKNPEGALGYREDRARKLFKANGLSIKSVHPGSWCGREKFLSYQDIIIATKQ